MSLAAAGAGRSRRGAPRRSPSSPPRCARTAAGRSTPTSRPGRRRSRSRRWRPADRWPRGSTTTRAARLLDWLLGQQYRVEHPYTHAAPGRLGVDRPGRRRARTPTTRPARCSRCAHLACARWRLADERVRDAAEAGVRWLLDLQNRDGGMPTFCRGWTGLPFDRSGPDLTAHAVRAWCAWRPHLPAPRRRAASSAALAAAARYLSRAQHGDGAFEPLWFGNEAAPGEANLTYGTAKVLPALDALDAAGVRRRARRWPRARHAGSRRRSGRTAAGAAASDRASGTATICRRRSRRRRRRWPRWPRTPPAIAPPTSCRSGAAWPGCGPPPTTAAASPPRRSASTSPGCGTARRSIR